MLNSGLVDSIGPLKNTDVRYIWVLYLFSHSSDDSNVDESVGELLDIERATWLGSSELNFLDFSTNKSEFSAIMLWIVKIPYSLKYGFVLPGLTPSL